MIDLQHITLATASQLLDFAGRSKFAKSFAESQLTGAVALHNILSRGRVAYLADEVGMGKTYVVLGTIAMMRHYYPELRVLYIVPRANLQRKWRKEISNFTKNNWQIDDHRVRTFQGTPLCEPVLCENLLDLVREAALDANRDFILRLTSFSLPLSRREGGGSLWRDKADKLRGAFPGLAEAALAVDGRDENGAEQFKDAFACAVNMVLPQFDVLVLDEGHNLKHGFPSDGQGATRNRLLAYVLGTKPGPAGRAQLERRIDRALILSATPVDTSFKDLWNQLDLLGLAEGYQELCRDDFDKEQKGAASRCLIRRLTHITIGGAPHTRNMYRREWRGGGVDVFNNPLSVPTDLQRLIVALMQKKVADVLAEQGRERQKRFSRSFQIGMLASFESFGRTAVKPAGEEANFDQPDQTDNVRERRGIDTTTINDIAASYRGLFQDSLPHPKMNAVVKEIWRRFREDARKTLVFVRRVHTVPEMVEKLTKEYNAWLKALILGALKDLPSLELQQLQQVLARYDKERTEFYSRGAATSFAGPQAQARDDEAAASTASKEQEEVGGFESLFSWFFRGKGPGGILSGASFARNRLEKESALLSTFLEDNWILWLLGHPSDPLQELAGLSGVTREQLVQELRTRAAELHPRKKAVKRQVFLVYQQAALERIAKQTSNPTLAEKATVILRAHHMQERGIKTPVERRSFPDPERYLDLKTFFSELGQRSELCERLWPTSTEAGFAEAFMEREQRRLLLASAIRLGHPLVDLWLSYVQLVGTLASGKLDDPVLAEEVPTDADTPWDERLAVAFVNLLDQQRSAGTKQGPTSFVELSRLAADFHLLVDVNFHELRKRKLVQLTEYIADRLGQQQPIAGMYGGVLRRTVGQFRMPGYPYVLVTTDVLQEGEDLHTYCDRIVHYGISWTASATEQRTGRIDRIGSLVQRRLEGQPAECVTSDDYLQVYFPYLADTYEYVQVGVVFRRLNRFMEMLHDLRVPRIENRGEVDVAQRVLDNAAHVFEPFEQPLKSGFEIARELIPEGPLQPVFPSANAQLLAYFHNLTSRLADKFNLEWDEAASLPHERRGTAFVRGSSLVAAGDALDGAQEKRFSISLKTTHGGALLLHCMSEFGNVSALESIEEVFSLQRKTPQVKVCAVWHESAQCFKLWEQTDLLFSIQTTQCEEVERAFVTTLVGLNRVFEDKDDPMTDLSDEQGEEDARESD